MFTVFCITAQSQEVFYQDIFNGGTTGGGFSTCVGAGEGDVEIYMEPGSSIKKAFLFAYKIGTSSDYNQVLFENAPIYFGSITQITPSISNLNNSGGRFYSIHCIEVTSQIDINQNLYHIKIPNQLNLREECPNCAYGALYLYVQYENNSLDKTATQIIINTHENSDISEITSTNLVPFNINNNIGFSIYSDRIGPYQQNDGTHIYLDNNNLGLIGGEDQVNSGFGCGVKGHYYYQNSTLFGLDDDVANNSLDGSDGIANIGGVLSQFQTSLQVKFELQVPNSGSSQTNYHLAYFLNHTTPCQEFPTTLNTTDTSLCRGDTVQLQVSGGNTALTKPAYEWLPQRGLSCYDCPNPLASPDSSTTYTVRIWNTDSCSKVLPVRVLVKDVPDYSFTTHNFICGEQKGALTFSVNGNDTYTYQVGTEVQSSPTFNFLTTGNTFIKVTGANGCSAGEIANLQGENDVVANFTAEPPEGEAPLNVWFNNQSENAHFYDWHINNDTLFDENPNMRFDTIGVYPITLVACKKENECCDTSNYNLIVHPEVSAFVPNIITPNGDGVNDQFRVELRGATDAQMQIRNRWGNPMGQDNATGTITNNGYYLELFWNGYTKGKPVPNGVYFYTITYADWRGEEQNVTGSFQVVVE